MNKVPDAAPVDLILAVWLEEAGSKLARAEAAAYAIRNLSDYFAVVETRRISAAAKKVGSAEAQGPIVVSDISDELIDGYIESRLATGISGETIQSELAVLRSALNWSVAQKRLTSAPRIKNVPKQFRPGSKELVYEIEEIARLLEVAASRPDRAHVFLFIMILLSTHTRVEAIYDLTSQQIRKGLIHFKRPQSQETSKRRTIVPIAPTLRPWVTDIEGKVIVYRAPTSDKTRAAGGPEFFERPCSSIKTAFKACLLDAGIYDDVTKLGARGEAKRKAHLIKDPDGEDRFVVPRGSPNTLRHTIHTYLVGQGVPQAQIDAAAGHSSEEGSGKNYTHLRPGYLKELIAGVESFWREVDRFTTVHRRKSANAAEAGPNAPLATVAFQDGLHGPTHVGIAVRPAWQSTIYTWSFPIISRHQSVGSGDADLVEPHLGITSDALWKLLDLVHLRFGPLRSTNPATARRSLEQIASGHAGEISVQSLDDVLETLSDSEFGRYTRMMAAAGGAGYPDREAMKPIKALAEAIGQRDGAVSPLVDVIPEMSDGFLGSPVAITGFR